MRQSKGEFADLLDFTTFSFDVFSAIFTVILEWRKRAYAISYLMIFGLNRHSSY